MRIPHWPGECTPSSESASSAATRESTMPLRLSAPGSANPFEAEAHKLAAGGDPKSRAYPLSLEPPANARAGDRIDFIVHRGLARTSIAGPGKWNLQSALRSGAAQDRRAVHLPVRCRPTSARRSIEPDLRRAQTPLAEMMEPAAREGPSLKSELNEEDRERSAIYEQADCTFHQSSPRSAYRLG
jgi:hypothetical protein